MLTDHQPTSAGTIPAIISTIADTIEDYFEGSLAGSQLARHIMDDLEMRGFVIVGARGEAKEGRIGSIE